MSCFGHLKLKIISGVRLRVSSAARCFRRGVVPKSASIIACVLRGCPFFTGLRYNKAGAAVWSWYFDESRDERTINKAERDLRCDTGGRILVSVDARARDGARCAAQNRESYTTDIHTRMKHDTSTTNLQLDAAQQQSQTCYTNAPAYGTPSCHPARHAAFVSIHDADRALSERLHRTKNTDHHLRQSQACAAAIQK